MKEMVIDKTQERVGLHFHKWIRYRAEEDTTHTITKYRYGEIECFSDDYAPNEICAVCGKTRRTHYYGDDY